MHEEGFAVVCGRDGTIAFFRPDGTQIDLAPLPGPVFARLVPASTTDASQPTSPLWDGTPLDVVWAIDVIRGRRDPLATRLDRFSNDT